MTDKLSARPSGLLVNTTLLEAGWEGRLVVEIANLDNLPLPVYLNEGIVRWSSCNPTATAICRTQIGPANIRSRADLLMPRCDATLF